MSSLNNKILFLSLFFIAVGLRLSRLSPNFEFVTTSLVVSSFYLSRKQSLFLVLSILVFSDLLIGNTNIFIFTWSGFLIPVYTIYIAHKLLKHYHPLLAGIGSVVFFYVWTNLGVWLLDSWGMYPKTLAGLIQCYVNALPFLKTQLASTLLFLPLALYTSRIFYASRFLSIAQFRRIRYNT